MRFQVVVTGAFSTGMPLHVRLADYAEFQARVGRRLEAHASGGWRRDGARWQGVRSYGKSGGGYSNLVPLVLIQRQGDALVAARHGLDSGAVLDLDGEGWSWDLAGIEIQIYDLGVGVVAGTYDVTAPTELESLDIAAAVYGRTTLEPGDDGRPRQLARAYGELATETVAAFREVAAQCHEGELPEPWLPSHSNRPGRGWPGEDMERGGLLWLHPVFILDGGSEASVCELESLAAPFQSTYSQAVEYPDGLFVPGIQKSVICVRGDFELRQEPLRLLTLNWAYYALFMEMDRGLLARLDDHDWDMRASLAALEREAEGAYRVYLRFSEVKARMESALTGLGPRQVHLWAPIADVTRFDELLGGVEGKLEVLQKVAEGRLREAATRSSRRSRNTLLALTALTVVTVVVALLDDILGNQTDAAGHVVVRIGFVFLAFLLAMVVYLVAARDFLWHTVRGEARRSPPH